MAPAHPPVRPWSVLGIASLAAFMVFLDTQVLFVAFDDIRASFPSVSFATMSWTLSAYTIALAAALVPAGRMADRFGRRRVFLLGLVAFTLASVLCAFAPTAGLLVAFRVVQALGAAALVPSSLAIVLSVFPAPKVPIAVAVWGAIAALAAAVGPTAGALLVQTWDWRAVFLANVPIGLVAFVLTVRNVPESREATRARFPDPVGTLLLAGALTLLALGIVQSNTWGWASARTIGALVAGLLVLVWFVRRTLAVPHPALDLRLFARPSFRWANLATAAFMIGFTAMFFALIQFTIGVWHYGIVRAGLAMMPGPVVVMVLAPVFGRIAARIGQRRLLVPGGLVYAASGLFLVTRVGADPSWATTLLPGGLIAGLGVALVIPQLASAAVQGLPPDEFGAGSAVNQAIRQFGATFGVALVVALLGTLTPADAVDHFERVWWLLVASGVLTSVAALALPRTARAAALIDSPVAPAVADPVVALGAEA
ncbi:DHA2 family efflux MFS transporter permease subunit [Nocardioides pocheonensis]|uniref:DHA2 family efflux MFS transporter permease subunit n=1 Tax=Nocardioides pocheonensis TaxID=661485 RepID=A0A3N0GW44_9ACTN|nr:DHA2 family efflux MFS transporter permease subunit [Nocardioides pocheonensis]RNM16370.1 DHA2 family efflux MFS transporter permease subunit [Nocardioides pocheonensis]